MIVKASVYPVSYRINLKREQSFERGRNDMTKVIIKSEKNAAVTDLTQSAIAAELKRVNLGLERTKVKVSEF